MCGLLFHQNIHEATADQFATLALITRPCLISDVCAALLQSLLIAIRPLPSHLPHGTSDPAPMTRQRGIRPGHRWPASKPDIRRMPFTARATLVSDNALAIVAGGWYVCALPIELFRAMSKLDDQIDMDHPWGPAFSLPDIETGPIVELVTWIRQLVDVEDYAKLDVMRNENGELCTLHDLSLVRAAGLLGMQLYVNGMYNVYAKHIKSGRIGFEDVDSVVRLALKTYDSLLVQMGNRLGEMVLSGESPKEFPWLEGYLDDNPWLKLWVEKKTAKSDKSDAGESGVLTFY